MKRRNLLSAFTAAMLFSAGCVIITAPYDAAKSVVDGCVWTVKTTYEITAGVTKVIYKIGSFTFVVVKAPTEWALTHGEIESIGGLPAKEAIRQGIVKTAPYVVGGKLYVPMTVAQALTYKQRGIASWYGSESGKMTANGEAFNPSGLSAAHRYLPIPMFVKVTNLENNKSIIVRVNDRGPFPNLSNPDAEDRIIDLSMGSAKKLDFYGKGLAHVLVEAIEVKEEQ